MRCAKRGSRHQGRFRNRLAQGAARRVDCGHRVQRLREIRRRRRGTPEVEPDGLPTHGRGAGASVPDGAPAPDRQAGHRPRRRPAPCRARLVRRRRRRLRGLQHGRVHGEGQEPVHETPGHRCASTTTDPPSASSSSRESSRSARISTRSAAGPPGSAVATWAPSEPTSTALGTAFRANGWCACARPRSSQRSIWLTDRRARGRGDDGVRWWRRPRGALRLQAARPDPGSGAAAAPGPARR